MTFGEQLLLAHLKHPVTLRTLAAVLPELNIRDTVRRLAAAGLVAVSTDDQLTLFTKCQPAIVKRRRGVRPPGLKRLEKEAGVSHWRYTRRGGI